MDTGQNPSDHEQNPRQSAELNVEHSRNEALPQQKRRGQRGQIRGRYRNWQMWNLLFDKGTGWGVMEVVEERG